MGIGAAWELDFWGKFRRALESADADLLSSVASYDDALVSLTASVASTYVNIRTYQERLRAGARERAGAKGIPAADPGPLPQWPDRADRRRAGAVRICRDPQQDPAIRDRGAAERACAERPAGHAAQQPRRHAGAGRRDSGGAGRGRGGDSGGSAAAPAGHPQRRAGGRRRVGADRRHQGAALPGVLAQRQLRLHLDRASAAPACPMSSSGRAARPRSARP